MIKACSKNPLVLLALVAGLSLVLPGQVEAQTLTTIYSFTGGKDGGDPYAGVILSGSTLYGTARGGSSSNGVVFAVRHELGSDRHLMPPRSLGSNTTSSGAYSK